MNGRAFRLWGAGLERMIENARVHMPRNRREGAAAIEFALILPVLIALLFGVMECSWLFLQQSNVVTAVREGVRYGVTVSQTGTPDPIDAAEARAQSLLQTLGVDTTGATFVATQSGATPSELLDMTVTLPYRSLTGLSFLTPAQLTARMSMLLEQQD